MNDDKMTLAEMVFKKFEEIYPEDKKNTYKDFVSGKPKIRHSGYIIPTHCFGFYDWFCKDYALNGKAKKLLGIVKHICRKDRGKKIPLDKYYISFKNCCPCMGNLYDCIRIFPTDENENLPMFMFSLISPEQFEFETDLNDDVVTKGSINELIEFFVNEFVLPTEEK